MRLSPAIAFAIFVISISVRAQDAGSKPRPRDEVQVIKSESPKPPRDIEIVSDVQGVNFDPYISGLVHAVRLKWYGLVPDVAKAPSLKSGDVKIEFQILKNGLIAKSEMVKSSGDDAMDEAAKKAVAATAPFSSFPSEFKGDSVALRMHFRYNPPSTDKP